MRTLIVGFMGEDRPGIVQSLAEIVAEHGGNWLESRMNHLAGHFAGTARIEIDEARFDALRAALESVRYLTVLIREPIEREGTSPIRTMYLEIVGPDRQGIVREVTHALARHVINVSQLETRVYAAAMSGGRTFEANVEVEVPENADVDAIAAQLDLIARDLGVEILLEEEPGQA